MIDHFKSSGNLVRMLGEQLVSNKFVALLELIKNAYDADARSVKIEFEKLQHPITKEKVEAVIVSDSGHGITSDDISKRWLVLGTAEKEKLRFSPGGRRMLGAKGIGRFAIQRLGDFCRVSTVPNPAVFKLPDVSRGKSIKFTFDIDWTKATDPTSILEQYDLDIADSSANASEHGTNLTVYQLRDDWTKDDIDRLQREISSLLPPAFSDEFKIILSHWKFVPTTEQLTSSVLEYFQWRSKTSTTRKLNVWRLLPIRIKRNSPNVSANAFRESPSPSPSKAKSSKSDRHLYKSKTLSGDVTDSRRRQQGD